MMLVNAMQGWNLAAGAGTVPELNHVLNPGKEPKQR